MRFHLIALFLYSGLALAGTCSSSSLSNPIFVPFPGMITCRLDSQENYHVFYVSETTRLKIYLLDQSGFKLSLLNITKEIINTSKEGSIRSLLYGSKYYVIVNRTVRPRNYTLIISGEEYCEDNNVCDSWEDCRSCRDCQCLWDSCCSPGSEFSDSIGCVIRNTTVGNLTCCGFGNYSMLAPQSLCEEASVLNNSTGPIIEPSIEPGVPPEEPPQEEPAEELPVEPPIEPPEETPVQEPDYTLPIVGLLVCTAVYYYSIVLRLNRGA